MKIENIKYSIEVNEQKTNSVVSLKEKRISSMINGALIINFSLSDNILDVSIKNNRSTPVALNNLRLEEKF